MAKLTMSIPSEHSDSIDEKDLQAHNELDSIK